mmetsp:Transcript_8931/g.23142  ORF Transcript_8931/g.23142 Transcript_8931/m.23142 type:complete len:144 (-) Transcript_8931:491-922(-)
MRNVGFTDVAIEEKTESAEFIKDWMPGSGAEKYVVSAYVTARKPLPAPLGVYAAVARTVPPLASLVDALVGVTVPFMLGMPAPSVFGRRPSPALRAPQGPATTPSAGTVDTVVADATPPASGDATQSKSGGPGGKACEPGQAC